MAGGLVVPRGKGRAQKGEKPMPEKNTGDGGGSPINVTSILALITLLGGTFLMSQKLSSDRPIASADKRPHAIGSQTLEARLWEDPFRSANHEKDEDLVAKRFTLLEADISAHAHESPNKPVLMPVMLPGGSYSEDHESRIRSRMAVVSALGSMGYAPEDAEHIGVAILPWPTTLELDKWKANENASFPTQLESDSSHPVAPRHGSIATAKGDLKITNSFIHGVANLELTIGQSKIDSNVELAHSTHLHLYYEWYRPRVFFPRVPTLSNSPPILVIWLDDSFFEDDPLVRFPLLFRPLLQANAVIRLDDRFFEYDLRVRLPFLFRPPLFPPLRFQSVNSAE